ncbi:hypothetical protein N7541_002068 [Penicillium brevicompactum]|uniref:Translation initiation factor 3 N-terminal domain-containing protein n=1 Tax=Penicillium brevicompactum TaxID=5074 RepID=A0A9W9UYG1_PENBR|nr:hypothetical protein N7541_002068 [Penicillium brevicompactum]
MNHSRGLASCAQVLRQVFITPVRPSRIGIQSLKPLRNDVQFRSFQQSHRLGLREYRPPVVQAPKNEAIGAPFIHIVNEQGQLGDPVTLLDALDLFDRKESFLVQVRGPSEGEIPICKIYNQKEYRQHQKALEKAARSNKTGIKKIELNWAVDSNDLSHRMKQLQKFLEKDFRVEILLTTKRKKRSPTVAEIKHVAQTVFDTIKAAGARQVSEPEGELGKQFRIAAKRPKQQQQQGGGENKTADQAENDDDESSGDKNIEDKK